MSFPGCSPSNHFFIDIVIPYLLTCQVPVMPKKKTGKGASNTVPKLVAAKLSKCREMVNHSQYLPQNYIIIIRWIHSV